jgi:hypothetical protein
MSRLEALAAVVTQPEDGWTLLHKGVYYSLIDLSAEGQVIIG